MEHHRVVSLVAVVVVLLLRWPALSSAQAPVSRTITVDSQGGGDFWSVQSAVNLVPDGNREWVRIHVRAGSYTEKVIIPEEKGFILLEGDGSSNTDINFNDYAGAHVRSRGETSPTYQSATFTVLADDFIARNIAFKNTHNAHDKINKSQAVAALVRGDRNSFYGCAFHSFQDTLCDDLGRHYFSDCFIEGGIDFIFGYSQSIYDACTIVSNMPPSYGEKPGSVTAHGRVDASAPGGFVFKGGEVRGTGRQYLGRAWNVYATVVYYHVNMSSIIVPQGWQAWKADGETNDVVFAEVGCTGPGSNMTERVPWEKQLSEVEVEKFVDMSYIDDGWIGEQPY
ncbi:probable pectinesterase 66 [Triticum urartu]|nr:probable pectinesterase 66 [Triticum urartu]